MSVTESLCRSWLDLRWHRDPVAASLAGERAHDGRYGRFDAEAMRESLAALRALAGAAEDLEVDSAEDEIDRTALLDELRVEARRLEQERPHEQNPHWWLAHALDGLWALTVRGERPAEWTPAFLARLEALPAHFEAARATLRRPPLVHVDAALAALGGGGALIAELAAASAASSVERQDEILALGGKALEALRGFGHALHHEIEPDPDPHAFALGEVAYVERLHHEHALRGSHAELHRTALRLREETLAALEEEAERLEGHRDWRPVVVRLVESSPTVADLAAAAGEELRRLKVVLADAGIEVVGLPQVAVMPPQWRTVHPVAATAAHGESGTLFLAPAGDGELAEHAEAALPALLAAHALPGRLLLEPRFAQGTSLVRRSLRAPMLLGGWSLLALDLVDELDGWAEPEHRLFALVRRLQAALRTEIDVGLHARGMTRGEAIDLLVAHLPMARATADADVRWCCAHPTRFLAEAIGRRDLLALRRDMGQPSPAEFLARLAPLGGLPIPLVRWGLGIET